MALQKLLVPIAVIFLLVGVIVAGGLLAANRWGNPLRRGLPKKAVLQGSPIRWRSIMVRPVAQVGPISLGKAGAVGAMIVGNFDSDTDEEVLRVPGVSPRANESVEAELLEVSGLTRVIRLPPDGFTLMGLAWDWDRDGVDEVLPEPGMFSFDYAYARVTDVNTDEWDKAQAEAKLPVYDIGGELKAELPMSANSSSTALTFDVDGDGWDELLLPAKNFVGLVALGKEGVEVWRFATDEWTLFICAGDYDGDKKEELILNQRKKVVHVGLGSPIEPVGIPVPGPFRIASDVDGDSVDEVLGYPDQIWNPKTKKTLTLRPTPPGLWDVKGVAVGDFDANGRNEIAFAPSLKSEVNIYDDQGQRFYHEEFGDMVFGTASVKASGKDHLLVQLSERILVYP